MSDALTRAILADLSTEELMKLFEAGVRRHHYDPFDSEPPEFQLDDLREEVLRRLQDLET